MFWISPLAKDAVWIGRHWPRDRKTARFGARSRRPSVVAACRRLHGAQRRGRGTRSSLAKLPWRSTNHKNDAWTYLARARTSLVARRGRHFQNEHGCMSSAVGDCRARIDESVCVPRRACVRWTLSDSRQLDNASRLHRSERTLQ